VRHLIVSGRADPQDAGELQSKQYALSVRVCVALVRAFGDGRTTRTCLGFEDSAADLEFRLMPG
jgi:hypothetical protein